MPDRVDDAARELYALPPEEFLPRRAELARAARDAGDSDAARAIEKLRKPTVGAWLVNALVRAEPDITDRLTDLGDQLRRAQHSLAAPELRELSKQRRDLVGELANRAFARAERRQPPAALRDEVANTFDAAIADPDVASRLGRLQRSEQWSGFGFSGSGAPELTLVRGGRDEGETAAQNKTTEKKTAQKKTTEKAPPKKSAAERRREERELTRARQAFEAADSAFEDARAAEQDLTQHVKRLGGRLAKLQRELDEARDALDGARKDVTTARAQRRDARSALDRAERAAD